MNTRKQAAVSNRTVQLKRQLRAAALLGLLVFATGCADALFPTGSSLGHGDVNTSTGVDPLANNYSAKAYLILQTNCVSCHDGASARANVSGLTNGAHLVQSGLVKPGSPSTSTLYNAIITGGMPQGTTLSAGDKQTISDWILAAKPASTPTPTPTPTPGPTATPLPATFTSLNATIFQPKCVGCHTTANAAGGYAYDSYAKVVLSVNKAAPTSSELYIRTMNGAMPKNGTPLSAAQEDQILRWIQNGALNN